MQLILGLALGLMLFCLAATVLFLSCRDEQAVDRLLVRLRGLYDRLPDWLQFHLLVTDNDQMSHGSRALAVRDDSHTATLVIVDEADLVPKMAVLLRSVKPTVAGDGRMIPVSRVNQSQPPDEVAVGGSEKERKGATLSGGDGLVAPFRSLSLPLVALSRSSSLPIAPWEPSDRSFSLLFAPC